MATDPSAAIELLQPGELPEVVDLLRRAALPPDDLEHHQETLLVARSASVTTAAASAPPAVKRPQGLLERKVASDALTQYHLQCRQILEELAPKLGEATLAAALERMETARRRSLEALAQATDSGG